MFGVSMCPRDFSKQLRNRLAQGAALDDVLRDLRVSGASIIECIVATKKARGCDLAEAKKLIHGSTAWADVIQRTDAMWDELEAELNKNTEPGASPNGGPDMRLRNSGETEGPPSVS